MKIIRRHWFGGFDFERFDFEKRHAVLEKEVVRGKICSGRKGVIMLHIETFQGSLSRRL